MLDSLQRASRRLPVTKALYVALIMSNESSKRKSCELAKALLTSNEDYLDNVLALSYLGNEIHGQCWETEFHTFGLIASETDHLPLKKVRSRCSEEFLSKSDRETQETIKYYSTQVHAACNEILAKYGNV